MILNSELTESILAELPGLILLKEIKNENSYYLWGNKYCAKLAGYNNNDLLQGLTDYDLKCEAAGNYKKFHEHDLEVLNGNPMKTLDIYQYAIDGVIGLIGEKKIFTVPSSKKSYVLFSAQEIRSSHMQVLNRNLVSTIKNIDKISNNRTIRFVDRYSNLNLTKRESECFFYLLRGKSAKQIAKILDLSNRTVDTYVENIKIKTGRKKKDELFELAFEMGILEVMPTSLIDNQQTIIL